MPQRQPYEDPQLTQLAQIAQIAHLLSGPPQNQQEIDQRDQATRLTAAIHLLGLQQQKEDAAATLAETSRYHTGELEHGQAVLSAAERERAATTQSNALGDLLRTPGADVSVVEDTLARMYPDTYGASRTAKRDATLRAEVAKFAPIVGAAKDQKTKDLILGTMSPEARDVVTKGLGANTTVQPTASTSTNTPGYFPGVADAAGQAIKYAPIDTANFGAYMYNNLVTPPFNLINSLVGAPAVRTTPYMPRDYAAAMANLLKQQQ